MEDPFVLRLALNVTRRQLWDLQNKGVKILYLILTEYKTTGQKQSRGSTNNIVAAAVETFEKRLK